MLVEKEHHLIDEDKLDGEEARMFIMFLQCEERRHVHAKAAAYRNHLHSKGDATLSFLWRLTAKRHQDDVIMINATIEKLIKKFDMSESVKYENLNNMYGDEI